MNTDSCNCPRTFDPRLPPTRVVDNFTDDLHSPFGRWLGILRNKLGAFAACTGMSALATGAVNARLLRVKRR